MTLLLATLGAGVPAQDAVDKAMAAYEQARDGTPAARGSALARVAALDDARVTALLLRELDAADDAFAIRVLQSIGQRPRGDAVLEPLQRRIRDAANEGIRRAAASALGRQGTLGIDLLAAMLDDRTLSEAARDACCQGLAASGDERAWRLLAPLALQGGAAQQLRVLRLFDTAPDLAAVTKARLQLVRDPDATLAATAFRQLAATGHERAPAIFDDLHGRFSTNAPPPARAELLRGLASILRREHYPTMLALAATEALPVRQALRQVTKGLAAEPDFVAWLTTSALDGKEPTEREVALTVLRAAPAASLTPLLDRVRRDLARSARQSLDLVLGLHDLLAKDPTWHEDVLKLASSADPVLRTAGLSLLLELKSPTGIALAQQGLEAKQWELRSVSIRYLGQHRDLSSIPLLIARSGKESGRLDAELGDALFALTGVRCWRRSEWDAWWRKHRATHELPPAETVAAMQRSGSGGGGATVAYYGIPLVSKRIAFLIDVSGSMSAKIGTDQQRTRLDEAKRQLQMVVEKLPDDHEFNVIVYETGVEAAWDALRRARPKNKQEMLAYIAKLQPRGATNIHDALETAFRDPNVDTIYLLSDGYPSTGRIVDIQDLADAVRRWNHQRQIVVHGIAVGTESVLLQRLAAESGGNYVFVR